MATPREKLAQSLTALRRLQRGGKRVFQSHELTRTHRERLLQAGFLRDVVKGWLISSSPSARDGESTPWYASFWEFCARYCQLRLGKQWHLSPDQSLLLHAESSWIPRQVVVYSPKGANNNLELPFGTSIYDLKQPQMPPRTDLMERDGLRFYTVPAALIKATEQFFAAHSVEAQVALSGITDTTDLLRRLLEGGHSVVAGRLAGAFRRVGRPEITRDIVSTMRAAGYSIRDGDPFTGRHEFTPIAPAVVPIVGRMQTAWQSMRAKVLQVFPKAPGLPRARRAYLKTIEEIYRHDAYHSLSIEGYNVSVELIDRVKSGRWDPDRQESDRQSRDGLAARGYWQAFQLVKADVAAVLAKANAGSQVRVSHRDWYRELFQPCVAAGLVEPSALAGYRNHAVYLRTSRYVPPRWETVRDAMPALFDLLEKEPEPAVRAVLGHWMFGFVHPYPDGNGRMARFLMNVMLASGGYPWTVIEVSQRSKYLEALDRASLDLDIGPFARFLAGCVSR